MKPILLVVLLGVLLSSCDLMMGLVGIHRFTVSFSSTTERAVLQLPPSSGNRFTGFGDYVTSITPTKFVVPLNQVFFFPGAESGSGGHIEVTDSGRYWDTNNADLYRADFTDPMQAQSYTPAVTPGVSLFPFLMVSMKFSENTITIEDSSGARKTFSNSPDIVLPLPAGYGNTALDFESPTRVRQGNNLVCTDIDAALQESLGGNTIPATIFFGNTTTATLWQTEPGEPTGINIGMNVDWYHGDPGQTSNFLRIPFDGLTLPAIYSEVSVSVSFDLNDLIQIYAGSDNVPYTADDVFVFAPEYWSRISVQALAK